MRSVFLVAYLACACGDNSPPPVEVSLDRLTARISQSQIAVLLDGDEVWSTHRELAGIAPTTDGATFTSRSQATAPPTMVAWVWR